MEGWEVEARVRMCYLLLGLLEGEVVSRLLAYTLAQCGVGWDEETGQLRKLV